MIAAVQVCQYKQTSNNVACMCWCWCASCACPRLHARRQRVPPPSCDTAQMLQTFIGRLKVPRAACFRERYFFATHPGMPVSSFTLPLCLDRSFFGFELAPLASAVHKQFQISNVAANAT
jgi:hypothetical protein